MFIWGFASLTASSSFGTPLYVFTRAAPSVTSILSNPIIGTIHRSAKCHVVSDQSESATPYLYSQTRPEARAVVRPARTPRGTGRPVRTPHPPGPQVRLFRRLRNQPPPGWFGEGGPLLRTGSDYALRRFSPSGRFAFDVVLGGGSPLATAVAHLRIFFGVGLSSPPSELTL